jgi:integrase
MPTSGVYSLPDYRDHQNSALRTSIDGVEYIDSLVHLDKFLGFEKPKDRGTKVADITLARIDAFKAERKAAGAANATINRALAALRGMFSLAQKKDLLRAILSVNMLPEPAQPRQGFLSVEDYDKLYAALPAYVQPLCRLGYYTGIGLGEILGLQWSNVDVNHAAT